MLIYFLSHGFACPGRFIQMGSYSMRPLVLLASFTYHNVFEAHPCCSRCHRGWGAFCLFIHPRMDIRVVSTLGL